MTEPKTYTLAVPGATLHYDVREAEHTTEPILMLFGSPMDASGFAVLAGYFPDRTVVTYDPRGTGRSVRSDGAKSTPELHADDLHRLITELGGPVDIFASSGGAVNALALVATHPEQVRTLVAHEPPAAQVVPDREHALAAVRHVVQTYEQQGFGAGMVKFMALVSARGPIPADFAEQPVADPAQLGLPADDGSRDDALLGQNLLSCTHFEPDFGALKAASTRIVLAVGEESQGELARRGGEAIAARLGAEPVTFPSHHGGFLGENPYMAGKPEQFAAALRQALAQ